ncbi:MAG: urea carboxylase-associated family protein [Candidatus Saccharibacteria bacterium]|nr:urea carboxylase-associated family protein [Microbacteriaceae bacterium]
MPNSVLEVIVPHAEGRVVMVDSGQQIRITNLNGQQIADTWVFCRDDVGEYHSAEHTRVRVSSLLPRVGQDFVTNNRRSILRFDSDSCHGAHDMLIAACDPTRYELLGAAPGHRSCQENLRDAMAIAGHPRVDVPQPINLFMNTPVLPDGTVQWLTPAAQPGDSVTFTCLLDVYLVVSACPQDMVSIQAPGAILITVGV